MNREAANGATDVRSAVAAMEAWAEHHDTDRGSAGEAVS